jgi:hypothetical protein
MTAHALDLGSLEARLTELREQHAAGVISDDEHHDARIAAIAGC